MRKFSPIYTHSKLPNYSSTNYGQYRGSDRYTVSESYSYSLQQSSNSTQTPIPTSTLTICYTPTTIPSPTCNHVSVPVTTSPVWNNGGSWDVYFAGQGVTETPDNPGNSGYFPATTDFPGNLTTCEAIQECAIQAALYPNTAWSFDIHLLVTEQIWECVVYYEWNLNPGFFNVENCDVSQAYGYTITGTGTYVPDCYGSNNPDCPEEQP
jgi:hypothetical protein